MKSKAIFYHAGCPVCVEAEYTVAAALDKTRYELEIVHLGQDRERLIAADKQGVKSVPAIILDGRVFHINFGAALSEIA